MEEQCLWQKMFFVLMHSILVDQQEGYANMLLFLFLLDLQPNFVSIYSRNLFQLEVFGH